MVLDLQMKRERKRHQNNAVPQAKQKGTGYTALLHTELNTCVKSTVRWQKLDCSMTHEGLNVIQFIV